MYYWRLSILLLILSFHPLYSETQDLLGTKDIHQLMNQVFHAHLEKKEISDSILQDALVIYINQFDPYRLYLLESDVAPFNHLSSEQLQYLIEQYKADKYTIFEQLNIVIQASIKRSRELRKEIEAEVKKSSFPLEVKDSLSQEGKKPFARSISELKQRLLQNLVAFMKAYREREGSTKKREAMISFYEAKLRAVEDQYLYQDEQGQPLPLAEQDHLFALHVLKALASSLDDHTSFYESQEAYDLRLLLQKEFQGIGLVLKEAPQGFVVTHLIPEGPAARNGEIKVGDILLKVDGQTITHYPFEKVMGLLHGEKETTLTLTFKHPGEEKSEETYTVQLQREMITLNNDRVDVSSEPFGNGIIGKITLHSFYQGEGYRVKKMSECD